MVMRGRREGEGTGWQQEGEENFIPIDKDLFNPQSLCSIARHTQGGDKRMTRGDRMVTRREENFIPIDKDLF